MRHEVPISLNEADLTALIPGLSAFRRLCVAEPVNDKRGEPNGTFDVFDYIALCKEHYEKVGIGADYVEKLFR